MVDSLERPKRNESAKSLSILGNTACYRWRFSAETWTLRISRQRTKGRDAQRSRTSDLRSGLILQMLIEARRKYVRVLIISRRKDFQVLLRLVQGYDSSVATCRRVPELVSGLCRAQNCGRKSLQNQVFSQESSSIGNRSPRRRLD